MDFMDQFTKNAANDYWICIPVHSGRSKRFSFIILFYNLRKLNENVKSCLAMIIYVIKS